MLFFTIVCSNHLALATILGKSIKKHMPGHRFIVCLLEKELPPDLSSYSYFDDVILAKDTGFDRFNHILFKYNQYEASGACKGQLFRYMYRKYPTENQFVYLDADTEVYGRFDEVSEALHSCSILLTPHLVHPSDNIDFLEVELDILDTGIFNTGFLAINRTVAAEAFIDWWAERLIHFSFTDPERGLYNEQRWIDHVPVFFDHVQIFKHPGYNVANWNLFERNITKQNDTFLVNGLPLRLFHFSGIRRFRNMMRRVKSETKIHCMEILHHYKESLQEHGYYHQIHTNWSYDFFNNGKLISTKERQIFKTSLIAQTEIINPYDLSKGDFMKYRWKR